MAAAPEPTKERPRLRFIKAEKILRYIDKRAFIYYNTKNACEKRKLVELHFYQINT